MTEPAHQGREPEHAPAPVQGAAEPAHAVAAQSDPRALSPAQVLRLQRSAGNASVVRMLKPPGRRLQRSPAAIDAADGAMMVALSGRNARAETGTAPAGTDAGGAGGPMATEAPAAGAAEQAAAGEPTAHGPAAVAGAPDAEADTAGSREPGAPDADAGTVDEARAHDADAGAVGSGESRTAAGAEPETVGSDEAETPAEAEPEAPEGAEARSPLGGGGEPAGALPAEAPVAQSGAEPSAGRTAPLGDTAPPGNELPPELSDAGVAPAPALPGAPLARKDDDDGGGGLLDSIKRRITGVVGGLRSGWSSLADGAQGLVGSVQQRFSSATAGLSSFAGGVIERAQGAWETVKDTAGGLAGGLKQMLGRALGGAGGAFGALKNALVNVDPAALAAAWEGLTSAIGGAWEGLQAGGAAVKQKLASLWNGLQGGVTAGMSALADRGRAMVDGLRGAASSVTGRLSSMWQGLAGKASGLTGEGGGLAARALKALITPIVNAGQKVWGGIQGQWQSLKQRASGWLSGVGDRARGAWDSLKRKATGAWDGIKGAWTGIKARAAGAADSLVGGMRGLWGRIKSFSIGGVIDKLTKYVPALKKIKAAADDPDGAMAPFVDSISAPLVNTPQKAQEVIAEKAGGGGPQPEAAPAAAPGGAVLARAPLSGASARTIQREEARGTATWGQIWNGIATAAKEKWRQLNVKETVKQMLWTLIWPWPTVIDEIVAIGTECKAAAGTLFAPRSLLTDPLGFLHDIYSNVLKLLDFPIIIWRHLVNAGLALMGWVTVGLMVAGFFQGAAAGTIVGGVAGALAGAGVGAAPGAAGGGAAAGFAGAGAGFGVAMTIGEGLVIAYLAGEGTALAKALLELRTGRQTDEEQIRDYNQVVDSGIGIAIVLLLMGLGWLGGRLATWLGGKLKPYIPDWLRTRMAQFGEGVRSVRKGRPGEKTNDPEEKQGGDENKETPKLNKGTLEFRLNETLKRIRLIRERMAGRGEADGALEQRLTEAEGKVQDLQKRLEGATTEEELSRISQEARDAEKAVYDLEVEAAKITLRGRVRTLRDRIRVMRERLGEVEAGDPTTKDDLKPTGRKLSPQDRLNRRGTTGLRDELKKIEADVDGAAEDAYTADSLNKVEDLQRRLDALEKRAEAVERTPMLGEKGLRPQAEEALRDLEEVRKDPLEDVNSEANHNHYKAARQEAKNIPLDKVKEDGTPWSHIRDLQNARGRLANVVETLEAELKNPLPTLTDEGIAQLISKIDQARALLNRLDAFLNEIGWPASRPHRWIRTPDGRWVGEGDPEVMGPRAASRIDGIRKRVDATQKDIGRVGDRTQAERLFEVRRKLLEDVDGAAERAKGLKTKSEADVRASEAEADQLEQRTDQLQQDIQQARSGAVAP